MASAVSPTLVNNDFRNWLKGALGVLFAKEGLVDFVQQEIADFHNDLLQTVCIPPGTTCSSCTTANVLACPTVGFCSKGRRCNAHDSNVPDKKPNKPCPRGLCSHIRDAIKNEHRFNGPSWKNTDARRWCSDAYEVSKCFMPPDGYSDKTSLADTDFNGILAIVINNKRFQSKLSENLASEPNICTEARNIGREIRHSPNYLLSDQNLINYIDGLIALLSDPAYLAADVHARNAVDKLKQLKTNTLTIHADDITNVLNESIKSTFDDQQKAFIDAIEEHFKKHIRDSVEAIDKKIQEIVDRQLAVLDAQTESGKHELYAEKEKGKTELKIQSETGIDELQTQLEQGKHELNAVTEKGKNELSAKIAKDNTALMAQTKEIEQKLNVMEKSSVLYTRTLESAKLECIKELKQETETGKQELRALGDQVSEKIIRSAEFNSDENNDKLFKDLKEDLIESYRQNESMIPAAPLVDEHKVPLEKLYVLPPMWANDNPYKFGPGKDRQQSLRNDGDEQQRITFSQLFLSGDNVRYRKIYITANAGFGKTSLSQKITMTWCQSHSPLPSLIDEYEDADLDAMKYFDLLFLLHLRDYQSDQHDQKCRIDDLIVKMVSTYLSRQYTHEFVQRILHEKKCLIILDGLDEWSHPGHCTRKPEVPHNNHPDNCTVLTTTRDWKMGTIGLSRDQIDRRVEISELDDETLVMLSKNAKQILDENKNNLVGKDLSDFATKVNSVQIVCILRIPYILLQLMCLFFGGLPIGQSKCAIYSNITEFTLERGVNKKDLPNILVQSNAQVPNCMKENETCERYYILLIKLGKLAFYTLFSENKESSLIFDRRIVAQYMTEQEIEFCLKVGLLCQTKDNRIVAVRRYTVFFQHKSVHEFFCAIYISAEWKKQSVQLTFLKVCTSLSKILEMDSVFVFICGMNPEVYKSISGELQKIVDRDSVKPEYRTDMIFEYDGVIYSNRSILLSYQLIQVQCLQESLKNGNERCSVDLHDILLLNDYIYPLEDDLTAIRTIAHSNKDKLKSLQLYTSQKITAFMQSIDPGVFTSLETLLVEFCDEEPVCLADILTESTRTLKYLKLSAFMLKSISLSDISITALTELTCLQSLDLEVFNMTYSNLNRLYAYIGRTTTLTQLKLTKICCRLGHCQLDLCRLNKLERVELFAVTMSPEARCKLFLCASKLPQLQYLQLSGIESDDFIPRFSHLTTKLESVRLQDWKIPYVSWKELFLSVGQLARSITIELSWIKLTFQEWKELLLSVGDLPQIVTLEISMCFGPSTEEWKTIVDVIKSTPTLSIIRSQLIGDAYMTLKTRLCKKSTDAFLTNT